MIASLLSFPPASSSETHSIKKRDILKWKMDGPCFSLWLVEFRNWTQVLYFGSTGKNQNTTHTVCFTQEVLFCLSNTHILVTSLSSAILPHTFRTGTTFLCFSLRVRLCDTAMELICGSTASLRNSVSSLDHVQRMLILHWSLWGEILWLPCNPPIWSMKLLKTHTCCTFSFLPGLMSFYTIKS